MFNSKGTTHPITHYKSQRPQQTTSNLLKCNPFHYCNVNMVNINVV